MQGAAAVRVDAEPAALLAIESGCIAFEYA